MDEPAGKGTLRAGAKRVVAFRPDWKDVEFTTSLWRRSNGAIFLFEHPSWPIAGWAAVTDALAYPDWSPSPDIADEDMKALSELKFEGYKGYVDDTSQRMARAILRDAPGLARAGRPWIVSALIGLGMRADQVERLPAVPGVVSRLSDRPRRGD